MLHSRIVHTSLLMPPLPLPPKIWTNEKSAGITLLEMVYPPGGVAVDRHCRSSQRAVTSEDCVNPERWPELRQWNSPVKQLVFRMLQYTPENRLTAQQVVNEVGVCVCGSWWVCGSEGFILE